MNIFTAFVKGESEVANYLIPVGGKAVLLDIDNGKMWIKESDVNGAQSVRAFNIKEIPRPEPVTRDEFNSLNAKLDALIAKLEDKT